MNNRSMGSWLAGLVISILIYYFFSAYLGLPFPRYRMEISLANPWLNFVAMILGPIAAGLAAFFGQILAGLGTNTIWWTWIIADGIYGLLLGLLVKRLAFDRFRLTFKRYMIFNFWQIIANILVWLVLAPLGDIWVYGSYSQLVFSQGAITMLVNIFGNATIGIIMVLLYQKISKLELV
ncbi:putative membrane protein [Weissella oryzae SG25]|uniref:Putative membrane protein n=1 Tax=Weissella oryzae (strain DSM 25784 / JCM 18191 / LMG 30913 / SG25) TaxID=1329250 RepID=A0A069CUE4_WEIOS|nr:ECF transporter S component [Weissella oryzae]GAK31420.1 putative membrane protein [Weissella oryzae SG25]